MENDDAWGRWYDPEEERTRLQQSYIDFAHKRGYQEGLEIGREIAKRENIRKYYQNGVSIEVLAKHFKMKPSEIEEIINNPDDN